MRYILLIKEFQHNNIYIYLRYINRYVKLMLNDVDKLKFNYT